MASDLGLHCLPVTRLGVYSLQWVKDELSARGKLFEYPNSFSVGRSKAVILWRFFLVCSSVGLCLSLFVPHFSFVWCLGKVVEVQLW